ncbi:MAG: DivIVA domain-containing protein [Balneolaceae bacterium]|nr:DivIVA domain-containing protein [Balneolaceae bacterium]
MKLTALEIKQQQFEKSLRGYDPTEVQSFLSLLANEWEHMVGRMRDLENQVDKMNDKLRHYERVEEALHETLQTAKSSAEEKVSDARKQAKIITEKAELEAETILQEANQQRREIRQSLMQLIDKRNEMIRSMRSYLDNAGDTLDQFKTDENSLFNLSESAIEEPKKVKKSKPKTPKKEEAPSVKPEQAENDKIDDILDQID